MLSVGIIGLGAIGRLLVQELGRTGTAHVRAALVREGFEGASPGGVPMVHSIEQLLALRPSIILEAAGQGAVREHGAAVLGRGTDLMVISSGALADDVVHEQLIAAARQGGSRMLLPVGAIAGIDGLVALRASGLTHVRYTSVKPPAAWSGTPAEELVDLAEMSEPAVFFEGSAREAARSFPKNANLAATVALAGLGLDATRVSLVADPTVDGNHGRIEAEGAAGTLNVEARGPAADGNPKTSAVTAFSMIASLQSLKANLVLPA
jgi:aspartate dehydrogenase